jgi:hypothetical protein
MLNHDLSPLKGRWVAIEWLDADDEAGWQPHDPEADDEAETNWSVGIFVSKGNKFVTLSRCHNHESEEWLGKSRIPIGMVVGIWELNKGGKLA